MDTPNIQVATSPSEVAKLITPTSQTSNPVPNSAGGSGASIEEIVAKIEQDAMSKEDQAKKLAELQNSKQASKSNQPLFLTYEYKGGCPKCGNIPKTIIVNVGDGECFATAFCISCNEQLRAEKVAKLPDPPKPEPKPEVKVEPKIELPKAPIQSSDKIVAPQKEEKKAEKK